MIYIHAWLRHLFCNPAPSLPSSLSAVYEYSLLVIRWVQRYASLSPMVILRPGSWAEAPLKRWQCIPPVIRADTSSKCCWTSAIGFGGLSVGLKVVLEVLDVVRWLDGCVLRELEEFWWSRSLFDQRFTCEYLKKLDGLTLCSAWFRQFFL